MANISGVVMAGDDVVATVDNGILSIVNEKLLPLYLKRTNNVENWLASRAIDRHRTNSRLLKKALRIGYADDVQTALASNAASLTDNYWFKPHGSDLTYADVQFHENYFDTLALRGDPDGFSQNPSKTPELTNTGSFEKCWKLIDGNWFMYKSGTDNEYFSELFICKLGESLGLPFAHYEMHDGYICTNNFVDNTNLNLEPFSSLSEDDDYNNCFNIIHEISPTLAEEYLKIIWLDTICFNMDRHTQNFGFLRDRSSGDIISMAPNYDNNIALISRGYPGSKLSGLIPHFSDFIKTNTIAQHMLQRMKLPVITKELIEKCIDECGFNVDNEFISDFVLNSQNAVNDIIGLNALLIDKTEDLDEENVRR